MIVDPSALVAIFTAEPDADALARAMSRAPAIVLSAAGKVIELIVEPVKHRRLSEIVAAYAAGGRP